MKKEDLAVIGMVAFIMAVWYCLICLCAFLAQGC